MPKKTDEQTRNLVVERFKAGASYSQITKETGLSKPVIWNIKKEAGLPMNPKPGPSSKTPVNRYASASSKPTLSTSSPRSSNGHAPIPVSNSDGVTDFQPTMKPGRTEPARGAGEGRTPSPVVRELQYAECDNCGTGFTYQDESEVPEACPECGV